MIFIVTLILGCVALIVWRTRAAGLRPADELLRHLRARGWGLLAIPLAVQYAMLTTQRATSVVEVLAGIAIVVFAPRLATMVVPFGLMILGWWGIVLVRDFDRGGLPTVLYGIALCGGGSWPDRLVLPEAALFMAAGAWLFLRVRAPGSDQVRALFRYAAGAVAGRPSRWARLLLPVLALTVEVLGLRFWLGQVWWTLEWTVLAAVALAAGGVVLVRRAPTVAALVAATGLQILGLYGIILGAVWTAAMPLQFFGVVSLNGQFDTRAPAIGQGLVLLAAGAYLMPRVIREHIAGAPDRELAALTERVETLTQTRTEATDAAAAELRRIERDLHDGAQARLVALGMSLRAAERLFGSNPDAALALVSEARETSSRALSDLRDLVRGIYPPVLADRGLADAVRALALDTPLYTQLDVDLPGEVEMPVGAAVYFAVAEALANAVRHSGARTVRIHIGHRAGTLQAVVTDDGAGGADPAQGTGLAGVERRLATFDGILAVNSPPGGPTIIAIEVPCALSSVKTSTS
jgi:signal transduction histidine kinase